MEPVTLIAVTASPPTVYLRTNELINPKALVINDDKNKGKEKKKRALNMLPFVRSMALNMFLNDGMTASFSIRKPI